MRFYFPREKNGCRKAIFNNRKVEVKAGLCLQIFFGDFYPVFFCERNEVFRERCAQL